MNTGFGQQLEQATKITRLFRKVNFNNMLNTGELCFSTSASHELISHGEMCLVFEEKEYTGMYFDGDADAGKNFGYDEFRVEMNSEDEILENLSYIVVPDSWFVEMDEEAGDYEAEKDPYMWMENISDAFNASLSFFKASEAGLDINYNF